jgi:ActR/RegA family two-component response regulator
MQDIKAPLVLVVEDETLIALAVAQELDDQGFRTCLAATEDEAMEAPVGELAAAVVNLRLGADLVGQRIIRDLRGRMPGLPVVVVTGYSCECPQADLRGLGPTTNRLHKPGHLGNVAPSVRDVIERARRNSNEPHRRRRSD